jgi:hypothetical protein
MRYVLAIVAFVLALPCLAYGGSNAFAVVQILINLGFSGFNAIFYTAIATAAVPLLVGSAFAAAGVAMLTSKPRREQ